MNNLKYGYVEFNVVHIKTGEGFYDYGKCIRIYVQVYVYIYVYITK